MSFKGESLEVPEVIEKISIFFQLYGGVGRRQATYQDFYGGFFLKSSLSLKKWLYGSGTFRGPCA